MLMSEQRDQGTGWCLMCVGGAGRRHVWLVQSESGREREEGGAGRVWVQIVEGLVSHGRTWAFTPREMGALDHCEQRGRGLTQCSQAPSGGCCGKGTVGVGSRGD